MLVQSWNCRGLNGDLAGGVLRGLVRKWNPDIVFLVETKMRMAKMDKIRSKLGFWGGISFPAVGTVDGICLWWKRGICLDVWKITKNMICMVIRGATRGDD